MNLQTEQIINTWYLNIELMIGDEVSFKTGVKWSRRWRLWKIGSLSEGVFERSTSTGSRAFYRLISVDATTFVSPCFVTLIQTICPKGLAITLPNNEKSPLPVDVRRSKTPLLKLPNEGTVWQLSPSVAVADPGEAHLHPLFWIQTEARRAEKISGSGGPETP